MANSRSIMGLRDIDGTSPLLSVCSRRTRPHGGVSRWRMDRRFVWVNGASILCVGEDSVEIDGKYYNFDKRTDTARGCVRFADL